MPELPPLPQADEPAPSARVDFPCPSCGAKMTWSPEADALACDHCGHKMEVPRSAAATILERPLEEAGEAARGLGRELRVAQCKNCGARVTFEDVATSLECLFCGSANVLAQEANRNALRPESLVPLDVGREDVQAKLSAWTRALWFRPNALKQLKAFEAQGVYVPCWTFDCHVDSEWSADAGHYYWTTQVVPVMVNGKLTMRAQPVRKVRWVPAWGNRRDDYDDVLVHASEGVPVALVERLGGFDTQRLVPYRPEYLAGWHAEEYQLDLEHAWERGQTRVVEQQERRCAGDVPGDTHRALRVHNTIRDVRWKHVLLPLWTVSYRHAGKVYTVLVNGQTGQVHGEAPLSWAKIVLFVLAVLAGLGLVVLVLSIIAAVSSM